ncbi:hypothetical protein ON010_g10247 [Phytophthora cinnamomi]|nr:hypothetical protein ON010_g10247 [Phytophthora cinnamomi]
MSAIISKRASTAVVLNVSLPRILLQAGELGNLSQKLRPYCVGPVAAELITRAEMLFNTANHMVNYSKRRGRPPMKFYFNSRAQMVHAGNNLGISVDEGRIKTCKAPLRGWINKRITQADVQLECLGLHKMQIKNQLTVEGAFDQCTWSLETVEAIRSKFWCDCISFYSSGSLCAHILASLQLLQNIGIGQMLEELEPRKLPGRPPKKPRPNRSGDGATNEYSVAKLVSNFINHPGLPLKLNILKEFVLDEAKGYLETVPGKVKTYALHDQVYVWRCEFEHGVTEYLEVEQLAECVERAWVAKHH